MKAFDPLADIENSRSILEAGRFWPTFHDAIVYSLSFWRGDVRPDDGVWILPTIDATFELAALMRPYVADLRFHNCCDVRMSRFDHNNSIYDLTFAFEDRGYYADGVTPLPPYVCVAFEDGEGFEPLLSFKCFRVEAIGRRDVSDPPRR